MTRFLIALLAGTVAAPALAQHAGLAGHPPAPPPAPAADPHTGHAGHAAPPPPAPATDPHAGHGNHGSPAAPDPHTEHETPAAPTPAVDPHAGHAAPAVADPHAGHAPPATTPSTSPHAGHDAAPAAPETTDPHAGHAMAGEAADPHAGHAATGHAPAPAAPPVAPPPPPALSGPEHAADTVFGDAAMAPARADLLRSHGRMATSRFRAERLELGVGGGDESYGWEIDFFHGGPLDRLWLKTEGEGEFGAGVEAAELQALWSHAIDPWFDLQAGLRYDVEPDPERAYLVLGIQGLAPYWFEIDAAAFLSEKGDLTTRIEGEYDLRITQRLILQPAAELELALQDVPELGIGAGFSSFEAGLRLRYEIVPEFAPYAGVEYERALGDSADFARAIGEDVGGWSLVLGTRLWF